MIKRLTDHAGAELLGADICIIGAGAAGLALAAEFAGTRFRVLVLESGDESRNTESDALNDTICVGLPHSSGSDGRARVLGGTTTAWGGQLLPLRDSETEPRSWVPHSGWPFGTAELEPFYRRAERLLGVEGPPYDGRVWERLGADAPGLDSRQFLFRFSQWAPLARRNMALGLRGVLRSARNVEVVLGATVVDLAADSAKTHVEHAEVRARDGRVFRAKARVFLICGGGIETPRLLLASSARSGLANGSGMVGRFFQDHVSYLAGEISPESRAVIRRHFEPRYRAGSMYTCKIEPTDEMLARHRLLNVMAHVKFEIADALGLLEVKRLLGEMQRGKVPMPSLRASLAMARGGLDLARLVFARTVLRRRAAPRRGRLWLFIDVEQAPNPDSRIRLAAETDRHGMPKASVDWRLTGQELETMRTFGGLLAADWQRAGLGRLTLTTAEPDFRARDILGAARDIYHHMGATRMSDSARDGVVDRNLRCHEVDNLYVASSAVFPAGGIANPTFTILALSLRLADRLKQELGGAAG